MRMIEVDAAAVSIYPSLKKILSGGLGVGNIPMGRKETPLLEPPQLPAGQITKNGHFGRFFHI
jgi:hypothetical protein